MPCTGRRPIRTVTGITTFWKSRSKAIPIRLTGMVFDLKHLKEIIHEAVIAPMDHRFLNYEVPPFDKVVPTAENVAAEIWSRLEPSFNGSRARLQNVRLYETEDLYVDYSGDAP